MAKKFSIKKLAAGVLALLMVFTALPVSGITASVSKAADNTVTVYRSYNPNSGEHFFTADKAEHDGVVKDGRTDEGARFILPTTSSTPVYRAYNPNTGEHLLVPREEAEWLATQGWNNEGVKLYSDSDKTAGIYRVYNPNATDAGTHLYTGSKEEADWLVGQGWKYDNEGQPVFYAIELVDETDIKFTKLEATGSKELTGTLSKADENISSKDITVKKGSVTLTPAELKIDGTTVVVTLGSKIVKDTYSIAYRKTEAATVETEDEKLVEFVAVGTAFAQVADSVVSDVDAGASVDDDDTTVNASIEYQAKNQYGENISADVLQISNTFGGKTTFTAPTAKKNGKIVVYDIPAALGIQGTKGSLIVVSKNGVSSTLDVEMAETAKVKTITPLGIYNLAANTIIDKIPAQKTVAGNYFLVIDARDQYGRPIGGSDLYQTVSIAQMLSNVTVAGISNGKLTVNSFATAEVNGVEATALILATSDGQAAKAGSTKIIIVGDRFGSVMDYTVNVEQIDLIKSFSFSAPDTIYNIYDNELEYTATSVSGKDVTDYDTLNKLVSITSDDGTFAWKKQLDGSAKLIFTPNVAENSGDVLDSTATSTNLKQNTVVSATATVNAAISPADQIVVPKTFTVYEKKVPYTVVKYTGDTVTSGDEIEIERAKLVIEDQYGNTMTDADTTLGTASIDYKYGDNAAANDTSNDKISGSAFTVTGAASKLYLSIAPYARTDENDAATFNTDKAQLVLSLQQIDKTKVTNLKAEWNKTKENDSEDINGDGATDDDDKFYTPAAVLDVGVNQTVSGVSASDFKVTGTVNGKSITLTPFEDYTIKTDNYVPITMSELETAVKTATVVISVKVTDEDGDQSTETVSCDYKYSGTPSAIAGIKSVASLQGNTAQEYTVAPSGIIDTDALYNFFAIYDQYGDLVGRAYDPEEGGPTLEISFGDNAVGWEAYNNGMKTCAIVNAAAETSGTDFSVVATLPDGKSATVKVSADGTAAQAAVDATEELDEKLANLTTACTALAANTDPAQNATLKSAADTAKSAADTAINAWNSATGLTFASETSVATKKTQYDADVAKITAYETAAAADGSLDEAGCTPTISQSTYDEVGKITGEDATDNTAFITAVKAKVNTSASAIETTSVTVSDIKVLTSSSDTTEITGATTTTTTTHVVTYKVKVVQAGFAKEITVSAAEIS